MFLSTYGSFSSLCSFLPNTLYSVRDMHTSTGSLRKIQKIFGPNLETEFSIACFHFPYPILTLGF